MPQIDTDILRMTKNKNTSPSSQGLDFNGGKRTDKYVIPVSSKGSEEKQSKIIKKGRCCLGNGRKGRLL